MEEAWFSGRSQRALLGTGSPPSGQTKNKHGEEVPAFRETIVIT